MWWLAWRGVVALHEPVAEEGVHEHHLFQFTDHRWISRAIKMGKQRLTKNQKRRLKKKEKQKQNSTKGSDNTNRASSVNNKTNARGNRLATNGAESRVDDEYVTEEMDAELAKHFSDVAKNSMFQIKGKEKDTPTDEADSGTNEKGANGAFAGAGEGVGQNLNSDNKLKKKKKVG